MSGKMEGVTSCGLGPKPGFKLARKILKVVRPIGQSCVGATPPENPGIDIPTLAKTKF